MKPSLSEVSRIQGFYTKTPKDEWTSRRYIQRVAGGVIVSKIYHTATRIKWGGVKCFEAENFDNTLTHWTTQEWVPLPTMRSIREDTLLVAATAQITFATRLLNHPGLR